MTTPLPATHTAALRWLFDHGGEGVIDQYGRVVAQGDRYKTAESAPVWLRLFCSGHLETGGLYRLKLAAAGVAVAQSVVLTSEPGRWNDGPPKRPMMIDDDPDEFR